MIMKFMSKKNHMIDFIFPVVLLLVFAVSALVVTLFAANVYQGTVESSSRNDTARTSLSYVTEKIHSADASGDVKLDTFDGRDAVVLTEEIDGEKYATYIYFDNGKIKELFAKADSEFTAENGTKIMDVKSFEMSKKKDRIYEFTCTDSDGEKASAIVSVKRR